MYRPQFIKVDASELLTSSSHLKARAAVLRLLFNPGSAEFAGLRSVQIDAAQYVCGNVNARDRSGSYPGYRAFVYTAAIDFARIDDAERIAQKHDAYRACPVPEDGVFAKQKLEISRRTQELASAVQKAMPATDSSALSTVASRMSPAGEQPAGSLETQLGKLASASGAAGLSGSTGPSASSGAQQAGERQAHVSFKATPDNESEWLSDRPPAAWPAFPPQHSLGKPGRKRSDAEAVAAAKDLEDRWTQAGTGSAKVRPSPAEITEALRSLLLVDPKSEEFPRAWVAFVRLKKVQREAGA